MKKGAQISKGRGGVRSHPTTPPPYGHVIKELHEEIKAKQKKKEQSEFDSEFDSEKLFCSTLATELKEQVPILRLVKNVIFKYKMENMNDEAVNFNWNKQQNVQSQFHTHHLDNMDSTINSPPMQLQSLFQVQFFKILRNIPRHLP